MSHHHIEDTGSYPQIRFVPRVLDQKMLIH